MISSKKVATGCTSGGKTASKLAIGALPMKRITSTLTVCFAALLLIFNSQGMVQAQKPLRVLVDASKDGGLWWFPQGQSFNPSQYHQGKALADFMRSLGWKVTELPRGDVITFDKLRDFDLVIKPPSYFNYDQDEALAYQQSVIAGTRLLLMGGNGKDDAVAEIFGLRFDTRSRFGNVKQWIPHALTTNIQCCALPWASFRELPPGAVVLAWLNQENTNSQPVLGYLPYGNGSVVFVGHALISHSAFSESLIKSVGRYTPEEIAQLPMAAPFVSDESVDLGPRLLGPVAEATLPQPDSGEWRFDWEDVPSGKVYEIVVLGPSAIFPTVRAITRTSQYVRNVRGSFIIDSNARGWSWRVRAQYHNGKWGPWSRVRRFNVQPRGR